MYMFDDDTEFRRNLIEVLEDLLNKNPSIELANIISVEGLPIASYPPTLPYGLNDLFIAGYVGSQIKFAGILSMELSIGELEMVMQEFGNFYLVTVQAGYNAILTVIANRSIKRGLLNMEMNLASKKIGEILSS